MNATLQKPTVTNAASNAAKRVCVKFVGVGGAGANILRQLSAGSFEAGLYAMIDGDAEKFDEMAGPEKFLVNSKLTRTKGCQAAIAEHADGLKKFCDGAEVVILVAGLGGQAGTLFSPVIARMAKECGALVLAFAATPFECEASRRIQLAREGLEELRAAADGVICLPNQKILKLTDENTSVLDTFKLSNELLAEGIRGVWRLVAHRGLIEIHFDDLRALLQDHHAESVFAIAEASGQNRSREALEKLLAHPMLNGGQTLAESETVLVSLLGGRDMTMADINRVMEQINRQCENAQVIMGAAIDEKFKDRLVVTLIATQKSAEAKMAEQMDNRENSQPRARTMNAQLSDHLLGESPVRCSSRIVAPPPESTPENLAQLANADGKRRRKSTSKMKQAQLPLEIISKGRFEKSEPTVHKGEDLDLPTYIRRGVSLN